MKVIIIDSLVGTDREVHCPDGGFTSLRPILARDGMGFTVCKTIIPKGPPQFWRYKHHLEACYCLTGRGRLFDLSSMDESWIITPGSIYLVDGHEPHSFEALEDTTLLSIFNPALSGDETHLNDGSYRKAPQ